MPTALCPGSGSHWIPGTGSPICPACHRGPRSISGPDTPIPRRRKGHYFFTGTIPNHPSRSR